tara:strand:+ start:974 stop:1531 length:558 start_codon:yes stop_codon:yes gene_type:complete
MVRELIRLDEKGKPLEAIYQVYEDHAVPEMVGEIDYTKMPGNRFEFSYFGLLRARLLAAWNAGLMSAKELGSMLQAVANSNIDANPFQDEAVAEANDETVIEMVTNMTEVTKKLDKLTAVNWVSTFDEPEICLDGTMSIMFGTHLLGAIEQLIKEPVSMFSDEQLHAYDALGTFFIESEHGVVID